MDPGLHGNRDDGGGLRSQPDDLALGTLPAWQGKRCEASCQPANARPRGGVDGKETMPEDDGSERMRRFQFMRIAAWSEGRWRACRHGKCRAARKCKGGSRGTFTRHGYPDCYTMQEAEQLGG